MLKIVNKKKNENEQFEKKTPAFFKTIDDCAFYCAFCNSPIKVMKAMLVWAKGWKEKSEKRKALEELADIACEKAYDANDQRSIITIVRVLTIIAIGEGFITNQEQYLWESKDLSEGEKF